MVASAPVERCSQHQLEGVQHGCADLNSPALLQRIRSARPYLLLVALGNPAQALRLARNIDATGCTLGNAVGGLLDYMGRQTSVLRCGFRLVHLEWLYRLGLERRRSASRYQVGDSLFSCSVVVRSER